MLRIATFAWALFALALPARGGSQSRTVPKTSGIYAATAHKRTLVKQSSGHNAHMRHHMKPKRTYPNGSNSSNYRSHSKSHMQQLRDHDSTKWPTSVKRSEAHAAVMRRYMAHAKNLRTYPQYIRYSADTHMKQLADHNDDGILPPAKYSKAHRVHMQHYNQSTKVYRSRSPHQNWHPNTSTHLNQLADHERERKSHMHRRSQLLKSMEQQLPKNTSYARAYLKSSPGDPETDAAIQARQAYAAQKRIAKQRKRELDKIHHEKKANRRLGLAAYQQLQLRR